MHPPRRGRRSHRPKSHPLRQADVFRFLVTAYANTQPGTFTAKEVAAVYEGGAHNPGRMSAVLSNLAAAGCIAKVSQVGNLFAYKLARATMPKNNLMPRKPRAKAAPAADLSTLKDRLLALAVDVEAAMARDYTTAKTEDLWDELARRRGG